jgi:hypothetical protein
VRDTDGELGPLGGSVGEAGREVADPAGHGLGVVAGTSPSRLVEGHARHLLGEGGRAADHVDPLAGDIDVRVAQRERDPGSATATSPRWEGTSPWRNSSSRWVTAPSGDGQTSIVW